MINLHNCDCMKFMKDVPDNYYELAIVDPPYGIKDKVISGGETKKRVKVQKGLEKFDVVPDDGYFKELFRISENQIIWGGNYFVKHLWHSRGWIFWDKQIPFGMSFAQGELAFTSFNRNLKVCVNRVGKKVFHPTEKPVALYEWLLKNYAEPKSSIHHGDKILDTHGGSMSIAIACHNMGFDLDLCELDEDYFNAGKARLEKHQQQLTLF